MPSACVKSVDELAQCLSEDTYVALNFKSALITLLN